MDFATYFNAEFDPNVTEESRREIEKDYGNYTLSYVEAKETVIQLLSDISVTMGAHSYGNSTKTETLVDLLVAKGVLTQEDRTNLLDKFNQIDNITEGIEDIE